MNRQEVEKLIALNVVTYSNFYKDKTKEDISLLTEAWLDILADYPVELINPIFKECLKTCKYPVTIADIFDKIRAIKAASRPSTETLWQELLKASGVVKEMARHFHEDLVYDGRKWRTGREIRLEAQEYFDGLQPEIKQYAGDLRRLIDFGRMNRRDLEQYYFPTFRRSIEGSRDRQDLFEQINPAALGIGQDLKMIEG